MEKGATQLAQTRADGKGSLTVHALEYGEEADSTKNHLTRVEPQR